jgi:hypothetical protein
VGVGEDWIWQTYLRAYRKHLDLGGTAHVPRNLIVDLEGIGPVKLGRWVHYVRSRHAVRRLEGWKVRSLNGIHGWSWVQPSPSTMTQRDQTILAMRRNGDTLSRIATAFNLSRQRVHAILRKVER